MATESSENLQTESGTAAGNEKRITVAYGDGIGPEIMEATLKVVRAVVPDLQYDVIEVGEAVYSRGILSGIAPESWDTIRRNKVFLKAPITTPQGGGYKSLNVTIRKSMNLFANVRPTRSYDPYVSTKHPNMDLVIVRENEEDLYAGIEHRQTPEVSQVLKLITRPGCERIVRYAFEYARAYGRKKVTCMTKDNIMKLADGLFHKTFREIAEEYPDIESDHQIIDIGAANLAAHPERMDVIVTLNLYGDILSDIASQVAGSVGLAGSANIGPNVAMFEAIHGSAPDIAGKGIANPSGLLVGATQMLVHLGEAEAAATIENAWLRTLEDGIHTGDIYRAETSSEKVGTQAFADAVVERLGQTPNKLQPVEYKSRGIELAPLNIPRPKKEMVGIDVFIDWADGDRNPTRLGDALAERNLDNLKLKVISNRGVKVYPDPLPETFLTDHWRCRFAATDGPIEYGAALELLTRLNDAGFDIIKTEHLYTFDGERGYSQVQGE